MLTEKEVKHIANLCRIELTDKQSEKMQKDLLSVLGYVEKLNEVKTEDVEPLYQTTGLVNAMREDVRRGDFEMNEELNELLIGQAPHKQERFIKVKNVLSHK